MCILWGMSNKKGAYCYAPNPDPDDPDPDRPDPEGSSPIDYSNSSNTSIACSKAS